MTPPIVILGAGPSGLMLGRLLDLAKIDYIIFDRDIDRHVVQQGGSLDIHGDSGQLALREGGLHDTFKALARYDQVRTTIANKHGELEGVYDQSEADRPEIDRKVLRAMLLDSVPAEKVQWGMRVQEVARKEDGSIIIRFADGREYSGFRLLVGADGTWSKSRSLVTSALPKYSGWFYLLSTVPTTDPTYEKVKSMAGMGTYMAIGDGKMISGQRNGDGTYTVGVCLTVPERQDLDEVLKDPISFRQWLYETHFTRWASEVTDLIRSGEAEFRPWPLYALPTEDLSWEASPDVTLIGDAAHVTTPFEGEGVNCAMFDSFQLAQKIKEQGLDNLATAVAEYEKLMLPRGISLISRSGGNGRMLLADDAPKQFIDLAGRGSLETTQG